MLARWLLASQKRPDADQVIILSPADAFCLRSMGFSTVIPGRWIVPALPPNLIRRYPGLARFVDSAPASPEMSAPQAVAAQSDVPSAPATAGVDARPHITAQPHHSLSIADRLSRARTEPIQRRILSSLAQTEACCLKRHLQQRLHRIPARDFNLALASLFASGLVAREARSLSLNPAVR